MALTADQRQALLLAERSRTIDVISAIVADVLAENTDATPLDIGTAFRDGAAMAYLVADGAGFRTVCRRGAPRWLPLACRLAEVVERTGVPLEQ